MDVLDPSIINEYVEKLRRGRMDKLIITVAVTGSLPTKQITPHVPITPHEIVRDGIACEAAGASVIHIHARDPRDESPATDLGLFEKICSGIKVGNQPDYPDFNRWAGRNGL